LPKLKSKKILPQITQMSADKTKIFETQRNGGNGRGRFFYGGEEKNLTQLRE